MDYWNNRAINGVRVNKRLWSGLGAMGLVCVLAACGNQAQNQAGSKTAVTQTAPAAEVNVLYLPAAGGISARRGVELALSEASDKAWQIQGHTVHFALHEVASQKEAALLNAIQTKHAVALVGDIAPAQAEILQQQGLLGINLAEGASDADGQSVFHINATAVQQGGLIGQYLALQQGLSKTAIISHGQQTVLTQALQNRIQAAGGQASMYILGQAKQADVRQLVLQLKTAQPEIIFYSGDAKSAAMLVRKLQQNKVLVPVVLAQAAFKEDFIRQAGSYAPGSMVVVAGVPLAQMGNAERFGAAFSQRFHAEPDVAAAYAYDAAWALLTAMKLADSTDPKVYAAKLKTLNMTSGLLSGALTFDNQGWRNEAVLTVYQVEEKGWVVADSIKANPNRAQAAP